MNALGIHHSTMEDNISNLTSASGEASVSSSGISQQPVKKKRNQPGHPGNNIEFGLKSFGPTPRSSWFDLNFFVNVFGASDIGFSSKICVFLFLIFS